MEDEDDIAEVKELLKKHDCPVEVTAIVQTKRRSREISILSLNKVSVLPPMRSGKKKNTELIDLVDSDEEPNKKKVQKAKDDKSVDEEEGEDEDDDVEEDDDDDEDDDEDEGDDDDDDDDDEDDSS